MRFHPEVLSARQKRAIEEYFPIVEINRLAVPAELADIDPPSHIYCTTLCTHKEIKSDDLSKGTRGSRAASQGELAQFPGANMSIQEAYNKWSATYDSDENLTRDLDQVVTRNALANLQCKSILEIGCGTGKNTPFLAQIGEKVHGIDFSEGMIQIARKKLKFSNITFSVADITKQWPCGDRSADLIVCNLVLEHIDDLSFIFSEAHRTLVAGGRFFICELHPFRQYQGTQANFQSDRKTTEIQAFVHHISDFLDAAKDNGFCLEEFKEWWHEIDQNKPPRLVSLKFVK